MLKRLRKKIKNRQLTTIRLLAAIVGASTVLASSPAATSAATGYQNFFDSATHTVTDNIVDTRANVGSNTSLRASGYGTVVNMGGASSALFITSSAVVGAYASGSGTVNLTNVDVYQSGSYGVVADFASTLTMTGGSITATGTTAMGAIPFNCAAVAYYGNTILTDVAIQARGISLYATGGGTLTANVHGQNITAGTYLMYANSASDVTLTASGGSRLYGYTYAAGTANLTLNDATWWNSGASNLTNLTMNGGNVIFTAPDNIVSAAAYKTLTVDNALSGNGTFYLNSNLSAGYSDLLTVTGSAGGVYQLYVANRGQAPSDPHQTLRLTNLTGANTATFSGSSDVGSYRYGVAQGSTLSGYTLSGGAGDFYLYNTFAPSTPARAAVATGAGGVVAWYGEMNEIKKRMGDLRMGNQSADDFWIRTYADKFNVKPAGGEAFSQIMRGVEIGKDNPQAFAGGKKYTGFVLGHGKADNSFANASGDTASTYLGAYGSWLRDDGSYIDIIGKYNWFSNHFTTAYGGSSDSGSYDNRGFGLSAEIGKRIERGNGVYIEPAAELAALWSGKASYVTAGGLNIETPASRSLQLRLGMTAGKKWQDSDGVTRQLYGKAGWVNEFKGESTTRVDSASFNSSLKGHHWVGGVGFVEDGGHYQAYLDLEKSWGDTVSKAWGVNAGYRWKF